MISKRYGLGQSRITRGIQDLMKHFLVEGVTNLDRAGAVSLILSSIKANWKRSPILHDFSLIESALKPDGILPRREKVDLKLCETVVSDSGH